MVIDKNSTVYIFNNVPLTSNYSDTVYFNSASEQALAFQSMSHLTLENYSYVRVNNNQIKVDFNNTTVNQTLYTYNYLMFRNMSFSSKWYYAFITSVEYVNNGCYLISYSVDVIQTFLFDIDWTTQVFIEREHPVSDALFSSLTEENIPTGEYLVSAPTDLIPFKSFVIVVACTVDQNNEPVAGGLYGNIYSGVKLNVWGILEYEEVNTFINDLTVNNKSTAIVSIFMAYGEFFGSAESGGAKTTNVTVPINTTGNIDGYKPRNNKLYNHPYNFIYITDGSGNAMEVKPQYESISNGQVSFRLVGESSCNPSITLYPYGYKGVESNEINFNEKMVLTGFPQCAYAIDSFKAWLAQNAGSLAINTLSSAAALVGGLAVPGIGPAAATGAALNIANSINTLMVESAKPPQASGAMGAGGMFAQNLLTFIAYQCNITAERARIIDDYFDKKGYATKRIKTLQRSSRPYWNYTETRECDLHGSVPDNMMTQINKALDRGVTWWKGLQYVGNYTLVNSPNRIGGEKKHGKR